MAKTRAKTMVTDRAGKVFHLLGEVDGKGGPLLAVEWYEKKQWHSALRPKGEFQ